MVTRRQFLARSTLAAAGLISSSGRIRAASANGRLNLGVIGTANRAGEDLRQVATENIVALCDVDLKRLNAARAKFPLAEVYTDYRRMLERNDLDAIVIGAPDHIHAVAAVAAMESGRHVYCEKPLARTVSEVRRMTQVAARYQRITQMGTQIHATENYHNVVQAIRSGTIGQVREVHVWVGVVYTAKGLPTDHPPVPKNLDWDLWLGPSPRREYSPAYVPKFWRRYWAFGGGTLSDMGCHFMDLPFWALDLKAPVSVEAEGPPVDAEGTPEWLTVRYQFPERGAHPGVRLTWYHGMKDDQPVRPKLGPAVKLPDWRNGVVFIGDKGILAADYGEYVLLPKGKFPAPIQSPKGEDFDARHHQEWIQAIKNGGRPSCNFDYAGPLTETVLLGNVAYRSGGTLAWNSAGMEAVGNAAAEPFIHHYYRWGYHL
jgi:predicted dehydrogenase